MIGDIDVVNAQIANERSIFAFEVHESEAVLVEFNFSVVSRNGGIVDGKIAIRVGTYGDLSFLKGFLTNGTGMCGEAIAFNFERNAA